MTRASGRWYFVVKARWRSRTMCSAATAERTRSWTTRACEKLGWYSSRGFLGSDRADVAAEDTLVVAVVVTVAVAVDIFV